jgi:DNA-binding NarL/FixJ family response regulator
MKKIRILLANNRPRIMREVIKQLIERQPDMEIVAEVLDLSALSRVAGEAVADVIIVALEDSDALSLGRQLLAERPEMAILALAAKGNAAFIEQVCLGRREIAEPSAANILCALRHVIQGPLTCTTQEHP